MSRTFLGEDGKARCRWCAATPEYVAYHDTEWGFPVADDRRLFEKLSLEGFQSGLSWRTILAKRDNFRAAFREFDFDRVARFGARDVKRLLGDAGIVRHRGKIEAVINNAQRARELVKREGSLAAFIWRYEPEETRQATDPFDVGRVDRAVEGSQEAGLGFRRSDHRVCVHAGDGAHQRSRRRLRDPPQGREGAQVVQEAGLNSMHAIRRCRDDENCHHPGHRERGRRGVSRA